MRLGVDALGTVGLGSVPPPALVAMASNATGTVTVTGAGSGTLARLSATGAGQVAVNVELNGTSTGTSAITGALTVESETATGADYALVLVPLTIGGTVFGVVCASVDPAIGGVWSVAAFIITIRLMRDEDFSKLVKRFAQFLEPPL
jgi:hypothetical protein